VEAILHEMHDHDRLSEEEAVDLEKRIADASLQLDCLGRAEADAVGARGIFRFPWRAVARSLPIGHYSLNIAQTMLGELMPLVGENVGNVTGFGPVGSGLRLQTWGLDFPPRSGTAKIAMTRLYPWSTDSSVNCGIVDFRYRLPNNTDSTVVFPNVAAYDGRSVVWNATLTHVTFGLSVKSGIGACIYSVENWA
jgi:hypothetical protein